MGPAFVEAHVESTPMNTFPHGELTYYLRGIGFRVHNALKGGHEEKVYEEALVWILEKEKIAYRRQPKFRIDYKGKQVGEYYPDLTFAADRLIVDLKATPTIEPLHKAQMLSYLAVTEAELGFVMNFGTSHLATERLPNFLNQRKSPPWFQDVPENILYPALTNRVLECVHAVHRTLGPGFLSQVYRRATRIELERNFIAFDYLKELPLIFESHPITTLPTRLFLVEDCILLATIAATAVTPKHTEKLRWAMQTTKTRLGLIANFYPSRPDIRFLRT